MPIIKGTRAYEDSSPSGGWSHWGICPVCKGLRHPNNDRCKSCQAKINAPDVSALVKRCLARGAEIKADPDQYAALHVRHELQIEKWRKKLLAAAVAAHQEQVRGMIHNWWEGAATVNALDDDL